MTEEGPCIKYVLQKYELEQLTEYAQVDHSRLAMKSSMDRRDAISKLKTNLDRIMEETENILRNEKKQLPPRVYSQVERLVIRRVVQSKRLWLVLTKDRRQNSRLSTFYSRFFKSKRN